MVFRAGAESAASGGSIRKSAQASSPERGPCEEAAARLSFTAEAPKRGLKHVLREKGETLQPLCYANPYPHRLPCFGSAAVVLSGMRRSPPRGRITPGHRECADPRRARTAPPSGHRPPRLRAAADSSRRTSPIRPGSSGRQSAAHPARRCRGAQRARDRRRRNGCSPSRATQPLP